MRDPDLVPVHDQPPGGSPSRVYFCIPTHGYQDSNDGAGHCTIGTAAGSADPPEPVDCAKLRLCDIAGINPCQCDANGCVANPYIGTSFDIALRDGVGDGSIVGEGLRMGDGVVPTDAARPIRLVRGGNPVVTGRGGSGGSGGHAGHGGAGGTGGRGGAGGSVGSGGGGSVGSGGLSGNDGGTPADTIPCCIADLYARCPRQGACQESSGDTGSASRQCYASGVTALVKPAQPFQCNSTPTVDYSQVNEIYDSNGSLCYSIETACYCGQACETFWTIWRNAAGEVVASQPRGGAASCLAVGDASASTGTCTNPESRQACTAGLCP